VANKVSLQEIHQLIRIKLLSSGFLEIFSSQSHFPGGGQMPVLSPLRTPMVTTMVTCFKIRKTAVHGQALMLY